MASAIENSIRRALEAGDFESPHFRQGVYAAAERAIERVLAATDDEAVAVAKRREFEDAIAAVEADYGPGSASNKDRAVSPGGTEGDGAPISLHGQHDGDFPADLRQDGGTGSPADGPAGVEAAPAAVPEMGLPGSRTGPVVGVPVLDAQTREPAGDKRVPEPVLGEADAPAWGAGPQALAEDGRQDRDGDGPRNRAPRAFAPPPRVDAAGDEPFEQGLDLGRVTPQQEPSGRAADDPDSVVTASGPLYTGDRGGEGADNPRSRQGFDDWRPGAKSGERKARKKRGGFLVSAIIGLLFLFLLAAAAYLLVPFLVSTASNEAPRSAAEGEAGGEDPGDGRNWISIFSGREIDQISTPNGGRVTSETAPNGADAVRISAPQGDDGGEIGFLVGRGVMSRLSGRQVQAELTVGSIDGAERTFTVRCLFEGESRCGRQRFTVQQVSAPFVFVIDLTAVEGEAGEIAIDPSIGEGTDLLVYGLRLTSMG
ncbi:hypothetical protein U0C82_03535 [Fulvimarina sp. 2208YS6-2-32]|uniref:Uncharacterized protein n=1 Tax=Fulvimarina uroteuthidis TaxID=3098149 RepID=A0ABU5HZD6_9HYPH|nr:hypothetical protein [Fulvimarina sp. 2208YS6-2-32]MDY8108222.1 hypothetical protein [Fulvimarina sp. 2208YS6-2-32]